VAPTDAELPPRRRATSAGRERRRAFRAAAARWVGHEAEARGRVTFAVLVGVLAAAAIARRAPWQLTLLVGWDVAAIVFLVVVWFIVAGADSAATAAMATREDETRASAGLLLVSASTASLVGVGLTLALAARLEGAMEALLTAVAALTVVLSWSVVHTVFLLRYAHLYFADPVGGVDFPKTRSPDYGDFAYLAFTIGMTYQVSDTALESGEFRSTALRHALLSFLFGAVIVAMTINVLAGFVR